MEKVKFFKPINSDFESSVYDQMKLAMSIKPAVAGAVMPDAHSGYALPIGGVIALQSAISPAFIGYDIACRMHLTLFNMTDEDFENEKYDLLEALKNSTIFGIGVPQNNDAEHPVMKDSLWDSIAKEWKNLAQLQLGTSGSGNHFADIVRVVDLQNPERYTYALMTHSGSRGAGYKIAEKYVKIAEQQTEKHPKGYGWLDVDTVAFDEYLALMRLMGRYASANHEIIHNKFISISQKSVLEVYQNHHNFAWNFGEDIYVHRKGATPAEEGQFAIIPGSSGTESYFVQGLGNPNSLYSASHGAGRVASRSQAKRDFNQELFNEHMNNSGILHYGISQDESFMAYKDINAVMEAQKDCVKPIAVMTPKIVVMG